MSGTAYVALCVLAPAVWGVAMYYVFGLIDKRRRRLKKDELPPPIDYSI